MLKDVVVDAPQNCQYMRTFRHCSAAFGRNSIQIGCLTPSVPTSKAQVATEVRCFCVCDCVLMNKGRQRGLCYTTPSHLNITNYSHTKAITSASSFGVQCTRTSAHSVYNASCVYITNPGTVITSYGMPVTKGMCENRRHVFLFCPHTQIHQPHT